MAPRKGKSVKPGCHLRGAKGSENAGNKRIERNTRGKRSEKITRGKRRISKGQQKLPDFSCLKKLIYEQKRKDNISNLFSFNDPIIKEKIDRFNQIIERKKDFLCETSESKKGGQDEMSPNVCETSTFGYTFIDRVVNFSQKEDIEDLIQHDEDDEEDPLQCDYPYERHRSPPENREDSQTTEIYLRENKSEHEGNFPPCAENLHEQRGGSSKDRMDRNDHVDRAKHSQQSLNPDKKGKRITGKGKEENIFSNKVIIDSRKKDFILDQLKLKFDEFKIDTLTIPQKPLTVIDENGVEKKKLFIFNINNSGDRRKNEKKRIQIVYDRVGASQDAPSQGAPSQGAPSQGAPSQGAPSQVGSLHVRGSQTGQSPKGRSSAGQSPSTLSSTGRSPPRKAGEEGNSNEDVVDLVNRIKEQKESYLYFVVKNNQLMLKSNNDYFSIMMHYLCEGTSGINLQMIYYLIMKPPHMDMLLYLILTYYKFSFVDLLEQFENVSVSNIVESSFEEMTLYDYYYYFFHILEVSHEQFYMSLEVMQSMKLLLNKYNFFLGRMHKNSIFSNTNFVLGMGDILDVHRVFLPGGPNNTKGEGEANVQAEGEANIQAEGRGNVQAEGETNEQTEGETNVQTEGETNVQTEGETNVQTDEEPSPPQSLRRKNGTLQYILNTKLEFIHYQQMNFLQETHWDEIENYHHLSRLDKLVYFTKDLYYEFTKKNIYSKLGEITCEQKHLDKVQMIESCKKELPSYKKGVKFMNFLGVHSHSFVWQVYCTEMELFCVLKFKQIRLGDGAPSTCTVGGDHLWDSQQTDPHREAPRVGRIEAEINDALRKFQAEIKEKQVECLYIPISVEITNRLIEKTKYINGTPLNEFIYSEFLSGIDLKLRVFKLKCIMLKIIKVLVNFLNIPTLIILKCSRIFVKEDSLMVNGGIPLGLLSTESVRFLLDNVDETIATRTYSKTLWHYLPPEISEKARRRGDRPCSWANGVANDGNPPPNGAPAMNCFFLEDRTHLEKAYSYMIGKVFEEALIDTFTGDKFDYLNFDEDVKDFLQSCLSENMELREPLSTLPHHRCFTDCFDLYINIYDDNINAYHNDREKAVRLGDLKYVNSFDYKMFSIPSESSSRAPSSCSSSDSHHFNTSSGYSSSSRL
ncbi:hypothetical protein, conserved in Apicomplexan species [Plasmodium knowlesi strain H]|uniref:Uncharacterized protein n=3 Tax=Plasmodium knowlesi TaxID=5850 RepID=A0A5K1U710_PLAKH|nr:uncharacterized protein PKNH_1329800 [Plasmodium knowlesi strain H]OTN67834.1 Uncharacterized protein PKNOH_S05374400 [Plasmodium knowlesi]CAA9990334.1 hypothetical protein, conserved in Apicomplexan species [Plasmodium knowlesi strain H]SBO19540.1 hypothetical protein, conserved in Apicomplexan species [Plasmodium knowlesi strain H]SBO22755.1 hypothetical protein, conserved in Apicomplexan species [Plasmodium knowlesi strain H]VVS79808.1 hypothetical protein, conserved in Apicomplexan spec|eukprot:XP_002260734.1 [Plasmodium knowlesi strain H]